MTTETMREAVARAIFEKMGYVTGDDDDPFRPYTWEAAVASEYAVEAEEARGYADAAIRTVLERLRERELVMREDGMVIHEVRGAPNDVWQAMLDAAAREALPEPADSGRG